MFFLLFKQQTYRALNRFVFLKLWPPQENDDFTDSFNQVSWSNANSGQDGDKTFIIM